MGEGKDSESMDSTHMKWMESGQSGRQSGLDQHQQVSSNRSGARLHLNKLRKLTGPGPPAWQTGPRAWSPLRRC